MTKLVIVESPTKAKTLRRFLGKEYVVESSVGHIRDLPASAAEIPDEFRKEPWARLGINVDEDFAPLYVVSDDKTKVIRDLRARLKEVDGLLLATDEDREGEAISWHLAEVLKPKVPMQRMVFHEITREAVLRALKETRTIDTNLVEAYKARRTIDRLYGYEVSPILWRKVRPKLSAGRVQSIAIRMIVERELARMRFQSATYWDLAGLFATGDRHTFPARLITISGQRLAGGRDFDPDTGKLTRNDAVLLDEATAQRLASALATASFRVTSTEEKPFTKAPPPPFTTSTLQQEGGRKLRFDAKRTMRAAQRLYELGYITYMRTDSVTLSPEAIRATRSAVLSLYGNDFLPAEPRTYKTKVKNAQEAHEAIRPAGESFPTPAEVEGKVSADEQRLYELIWMRTMACQMKDARGRRMTVRVAAQADGKELVFQATGNVIDFPGFLRAYVEGSDDPDAALADKEVILPPMREGEAVSAESIQAEGHTTQPPARFTEASLVKAMEESGIGRPSTYASIIDTIIRRDYTFKKGSALVPTFVAFAVVRLMTEHFGYLVDLNFTVSMEDRLDAIARGEGEALPYLKEFYFGNGKTGLRPLLNKKEQDIDPRTVCSIPLGIEVDGETVVIRVGRYGPFLQSGEETAPIPEGLCPDEIDEPTVRKLLAAKKEGPQTLGAHPDTGEPIYVKSGRFGPYVQLGDATDDAAAKPKMSSLLKGMTPDTLTLEVAVQLLALPREVGVDDAGVPIMAHNGRYGPYIKRGADTRSLALEDNLLTVGRERALELLAQEPRRRRQAAAEPLRTFAEVEALDGATIRVLPGRYGPYATDGETNASLPRDLSPDELTIAQAVQLILDRRARGPAKRKKVSKKKSAKKATSKTSAETATEDSSATPPGKSSKPTTGKSTKKVTKKTTKKTAKKKSSRKSVTTE
ncbi:MAG: type I DNA topoisomerase [Planctomycetota bacterium]